MRITNLDLNLGEGRSLQASDLNYIVDESDVLCFQNGLIETPEGWTSDSLSSVGMIWRSTSTGEVRSYGTLRKWGHSLIVNGGMVISVDLPKTSSLSAVVKLVKKARDKFDGPVVLTGDWYGLTQKQTSYLRTELDMGYVGEWPNGFFVNDTSYVEFYRRLAITNGNRSVYSMGVRNG